MGVIYRGAKDKAVSLSGLLHKFVDCVVGENTAGALLTALAAADTVPDGAAAELENLVLNDHLFQFLPHFQQGEVSIPLGLGSAVQHQNFHRGSS